MRTGRAVAPKHQSPDRQRLASERCHDPFYRNHQPRTEFIRRHLKHVDPVAEPEDLESVQFLTSSDKTAEYTKTVFGPAADNGRPTTDGQIPSRPPPPSGMIC